MNAGKTDIAEAGLTLSLMREMLWLTAGYYLQKALHRPISPEKKETFFLGFRDVLRVYGILKKEAHS